MVMYVVDNENQTSVKVFILLGLSNVFALRIVYSLLFLVLYIITLCMNFLLVVVVRSDHKLRTPMYFFLSNLSVIDICFSSSVVPKILANTLSKDRSLSFLGCATQLYVHLALGATECLLLAVMSYDRYIAICKPLRYSIIMSERTCLRLAFGCWVVSFVNSVILTVFTFRLSYCGANHVNHFFCEMPFILRLSCQDFWFSEVVEYISAALIAVGSFSLILLSYFRITLSILSIRTANQRHKAFSTCASHLTVVSMFFGTVLFMHLRPPSHYSPDQDRVLAILYTVVTPVLNPIIYSVRNKDIKDSLQRTINVMFKKFLHF
ncbi:olfactory receptor 5AP2-like [Dendropsophus ebraccatus]|uniref:olfactory receptor 5AP2-like n=1 Tax=Dendropsophus ebraccatus TaxID=150705 RepID=UPI003831E27F